MINAISAMHAAIRSKRRRDEPTDVMVEVKKRRRKQDDDVKERPGNEADQRGRRA